MVRYLRLGKESSYAQLPASLPRALRILNWSGVFEPNYEYPRTIEGGRQIEKAIGVKQKVSGSIDFYATYDNIGELLIALLGKVTTTNPASGVYNHVFVPKPDLSTVFPSYSIEVGLDEVTAIQVLGCAVNKMGFDCEGGDKLGFTADILGNKEQTASLASGLTYSTLDYIHSKDVVTCTIGGSSIDLERFSLTLENGLPEAYKLGSQYPCRVDLGPLEVTGELSIRFLSTLHFTDFLNGSQRALQIKFQGPVIATGYNYHLQFDLPAMNYDAGDVEVNEQDRLVQNLEFTALKSGVNDAVKITLQNNVSSY